MGTVRPRCQRGRLGPQTLMYLPTFTWVGAFPYYRVVDLVKWACSHLLAWEVRCGDMVDEESGTRMLH
jgi:hypothetical protein